ncbi:MAG: hypothetical protein AAF266_10000 [Planctomycetota bacterium]
MRPRRAIAALLAVYSMVIASGAPLPIGWVAASVVPVAGDDVPTERYPCENCPCGCGTAARCWAKCCCHTLPQRLAWARREGVRPPEEVLNRAAGAGYDVSDWRPAKGSKSYVVRLPASVSSAPPEPADVPPCCQARVAKAGETAPAEKPQPTTPAKPGVSLMQALACQGLAEAWFSFGEAPLVAAAEILEIEAVETASLLPASLWCHFDEAPTPPPPEARVIFIG